MGCVCVGGGGGGCACVCGGVRVHVLKYKHTSGRQ